MNIVFCVDKFPGGAGNVVQQLASTFAQDDDNNVTVTVIEDSGVLPKYDFSKVTVINRRLDQTHLSSPFASIRRYVSQLKSTRSVIMSRKPDVVVSFLNSISPEVLFSLVGTGIPVLVSERSNPYQEWDANSVFFNFKWWLSYKLAAGIVYQFDAFSDFFKSPKKKGKVAVIPNMVLPPKRILPHVESDVVRFCTFATLIPLKRHELMIEMFAEVHNRYPNTELTIYGNGPLAGQLRCKADMYEGVSIKAAVTDSFSKHPYHDIFLLTSEREGFPNALLEALASGLPVIAFRCHDGLKEILDGTDGFLVDNRESFIDAMESFVTNPGLISSMGSSAKAKASVYSSDQVFSLWKQTIESCIK